MNLFRAPKRKWKKWETRQMDEERSKKANRNWRQGGEREKKSMKERKEENKREYQRAKRDHEEEANES